MWVELGIDCLEEFEHKVIITAPVTGHSRRVGGDWDGHQEWELEGGVFSSHLKEEVTVLKAELCKPPNSSSGFCLSLTVRDASGEQHPIEVGIYQVKEVERPPSF